MNTPERLPGWDLKGRALFISVAAETQLGNWAEISHEEALFSEVNVCGNFILFYNSMQRSW